MSRARRPNPTEPSRGIGLREWIILCIFAGGAATYALLRWMPQ